MRYVEYDFENDEEQFSLKKPDKVFNLGNVGYFDAVDEEDINIVGSCNGLVCLTTKVDRCLSGHVYICNPITHECVELPSLVPKNKDYEDAGYNSMCYGFGYLPSSNEYKVVRISYKWKPATKGISSGKVHVYTLGDGRGWIDRGEIKGELLCYSECESILVDGALHWMDNVSPRIVVFNLTYEKLCMLPLPPRSPSDWGNKQMMVLGGQFCVFQATTSRCSNIWLLKKKMGDDSDCEDMHRIWSKRSTVTMEADIHQYTPLTITKNGNIILLYKEKWNQAERSNVVIHYDPKTSYSKELGDLGLPLPGKTIPTNSYISLKSVGEKIVFARL